MKMLVVALVLSLAAIGHCQDSIPVHPALNPYQRNPLLFNPLTYTFYSTVRAISTVSTYCFTVPPAANCPPAPPVQKLNEDVAPTAVQSVEPTAAPVDEAIREAREAQFDPYGPYYMPSYGNSYYAPYIRGSFGSFQGNYPTPQRLFLAFTNTFVTLYTTTTTITFPITLGCDVNPIPGPACVAQG